MRASAPAPRRAAGVCAPARAAAPGHPPPRPPHPEPPAASARDPASPVELAVRIGLASSTGRLDLSECGLTALPPEVLELGPALTDLSVAGNALASLPPDLGARLPSLSRLQLAGNELSSLPDSITQLTDLEGLWVHGNALTALPDGLGALAGLRALSAAGNALTALPPSFGCLSALEDAALGGNRLASLPNTLAGLTSLRKLALHGNSLVELPPSLGSLPSLASLSLQGNALTRLPGGSALCGLRSLESLNVADNALTEVPASLGDLPRLKVLTLYGNALRAVPPEVLSGPASSVWLEGNPLDAGVLAASLGAGAAAGPAVGLDAAQARAVEARGVPPSTPRLRVSTRAADAPGYWKLDVGPPGAPGAGTAPGDPVVDAAGRPAAGGRALVVAFGSAPGEPNWGGLLGRLRAEAMSRASACDAALAAFDVLYVVDPWRSWYDGGGPGYDTWASHLAATVAPYDGRVLLLGDSMGATAALLFGGAAASSPASSILAFCPQLDLGSSSIRPGGVPADPAGTAAWRDALRERALAGAGAAAGAGARVAVHVGSWLHDVDQAAWLEKGSASPPPTVKVWGVSTHRLAAALDARGELLPIVRGALGGVMGVKSGDGVRVANLL